MPKLGEIKKGWGKRIRKVRDELGVSQSQFGDLVGVSYVYIWMLERESRRPSQALVIAIATRTGTNEGWLRTGKLG